MKAVRILMPFRVKQLRFRAFLPMPAGAKIGRNGIVTRLAKGKKTGKLSTIPGRVTVQPDTWTAQFTDENGKMQRIFIKTTALRKKIEPNEYVLVRCVKHPSSQRGYRRGLVVMF